jgi:hypothetical protein
LEGTLPVGYRATYKPYLFHTKEHRSSQSEDGWHSFYMTRNERKSIWGEIHFRISNQNALSPYRAPFGSFQFATEVEPAEISQFIQWTESRLKQLGASRVSIKNHTGFYPANHQAILEVLLLTSGYQVTNAEIGAGLVIEKKAFVDKIHAWERRKLRQAKNKSLRFEKTPLKQLSRIYHFIAACRQERNQTISLSWAEMEKAVSFSQKSFHLFQVVRGEQIAAAAITLDVGNHVLYTFYYAHASEFDTLSPVVLLLEGIYKWSSLHHFMLIDLGTSSINGVPNFPLLHFKRNVGSLTGHKFTFEKSL